MHVDPVTVTMVWRSLGPGRTVLVTDAVAASGLDSIRSRLGHREVVTDDVSVRLPDRTLAGSTLSLDRAIRNLVDMTGCSAAEAIRAGSANPAEVLGLNDRGRIEPGTRADLVLFDDTLHVRSTLIGGRTAWES